jgi:hypothetical protein
MSYVPFGRFISDAANVGLRDVWIINTSIEGTHWVVACASHTADGLFIWIIDPLGSNTPYTASLIRNLLFYASDAKIKAFHLDVQAPGSTSCSFFTIYWFCNIRNMLLAADFSLKWDELISMIESDGHEGPLKAQTLGPLPGHFQDICLAILVLIQDGADLSSLGLYEQFGHSFDAMLDILKPLLPIVASEVVIVDPHQDGSDGDVQVVKALLSPSSSTPSSTPELRRRATTNAER